jgi:A/G-specific adenine glycosylase
MPTGRNSHQARVVRSSRSQSAGRQSKAAVDKLLFRRALFAWWRRHKIDYPWRSYSDPWHVLLAETLLRKTNAEKVARFIPKVIEAFPTPDSILLQQQGLESSLKPFGMYRKKASELTQLAEAIVERHGGQVPNTLDDLKALPGVGDYIANAVLCFGFGVRRPVVDINVIRVFSHVFGFSSPRSRPRTDPEVWRFAEELLPKMQYKEFNWALLDLGKKLRTKEAAEVTWLGILGLIR